MSHCMTFWYVLKFRLIQDNSKYHTLAYQNVIHMARKKNELIECNKSVVFVKPTQESYQKASLMTNIQNTQNKSTLVTSLVS